MDEKEARDAIFNMVEGSVKTFFDSSLSFEEVIDLIPVRPLSEDEEKINEIYQSRIEGLYKKIKP
jgi:pyrroline-5-carboxylate reductase